ncbi:PAS domain S-box protein [Candidatus Venteria ishoeyi]|uniref:histidine kinase n=1 Tax=Candidatus Venteria ishoeyi TaxID=1899563 RepID=A0A1H6F5M8_9GAMM|nr:PAS domain S-box protein [Candidatus Venteria ishoeyi]SEH04376.1 Aerobic respiration control sensor protein ArcB [Candidatus Venteria ishoeyi]
MQAFPPLPTNKNILIVDDDAEGVRFLSRILKQEHYTVRAALNGTAAFKSIKTKTPDLILLDVNMPDMSGFEVCRRLQAMEAFCEIPILFISAREKTADKLKGFEVGGSDYITKPFTPEEVLARVKTHLKLSASMKQLEAQNTRLGFQAQLLDSIHESVIATDLEGRVVYWGKGAERLYGYVANKVLEQPLSLIIETGTEEEERERIHQVHANGEWRGQYRQKHKNGATFWVETFISSVYDENQKSCGLISISHNISMQKQGEMEKEATAAISRLFLSDMELPEIYVQLVEILATCLEYPIAALELYDQSATEMIFTAAYGMPELSLPLRVPITQTLSGSVAQSGEAMVETHAGQGHEYQFQALHKLQVETFLCVPVIIKGAVFATLSLSDKVVRSEPETLLHTMQNIANHLALDIARKQAEKALENRQIFLEAILECTANGIVTCNKAGILSYFNRAAMVFHGLPAEPLPQEGWSKYYDLFQEDGKTPLPLSDIPLVRALKGEKVKNEECVIAPKGLPARSISVTGQMLIDADGNKLGAVVSMNDITERKQAELKLRESENRFRQLANSLPQLVWTCQADGACDFFSQQWLSYTGIDAELQLGFDWLQQVHPNDRKPTVAAWNAAVQAGTEFHVEFRIRRHDGIYRWFDTRAIRLLDAQGRTIKWFGSNTDITELREAELMRRLILDTVVEGIFGLDEDGLCTFINQAGAKLLGYEIQDLLGHYLHPLIHPTDLEDNPLPEEQCSILSTIHSHDQDGTEQRFTRADGSYFPAWVYARCVEYNDHIRGTVASFIDISERKNLEASLRAERDFAESLINTAPAIVLVLDTQGRIMRFNPFMEQVSGYRLNEVQGNDWFETFLPKRDWKGIKQVFLSAIGDIQTRGNLNPIVTKDGRELLVEWSDQTLKDINGKVTGLLSIGQDISERLFAENALRESENKFRSLVETTSDWIWAIDKNGKYTYTSPAIKDLLGYTSEEVLGKTPFELMSPSEARRIAAEFSRIAAKYGPIVRLENTCRHKEGHDVILETSGVAVYDASGSFQGYRGIDRDITEHKKIQHALQRSRDELEQRVEQRTKQLATTNQALAQAKEAAEAANRAKSMFLANMSHELRTPLNAILGFSQLMARNPAVTSEQQKNLTTINRAGEHLLAMINDVLDLSKIEAGQIEVHPETFNLKHLLQNMSDIFHQRTQAKNLKFTLDLEAKLPALVRADPGKLRQIIANLLGNAIKFTEHGKISLGVRILPPVTAASQSRLQVAVQDTGQGIATSQLNSVFKPFIQVGPTTSQQKGTGLGLAISRIFVELMGGKITVESVLNQGAKFYFDIPLEIIAQQVDSHTSDKTLQVNCLQSGQPQWRILIADDDADNRALLSKLLQQVGFNIREAVDGAETVALFQSWNPHFIWLDVRMPVMDGYEAARKIRSLAGGDKVKIVAVTANAFEEDRKKILDAGCDDFLSKPYMEQQIFQYMKVQLGLQYSYKRPTIKSPEVSTQHLSTADLKVVPIAMLKSLEQAALSLDQEEINKIAQQIHEQNPVVAKRIQNLVEQFDFGYLYDTCEQVIFQVGNPDNEN